MENLLRRLRSHGKGLIPDVLEYKFERMSRDAYHFFRGSCALFYEEVHRAKPLPPSPLTWNCGDLHLENVGTYKGDNRLVYFDVNDFDEAILAPAAYELVHVLTSIFIAFDALNIGRHKADKMVSLFVKKYAETLEEGKAYYLEPQTATGVIKQFLDAVSQATQKDMLKKRTFKSNGERLLKVNNKKTFALEESFRTEVMDALTAWIHNHNDSPCNYEVKDVVFRRAGLGSLGLKRYLALLKSTNTHERYMLVDMKEARHPAMGPVINVPQPRWRTEAERVVAVQKRMQNVSPALLSAISFRHDSYVVHELNPHRDNLNISLIRHEYRHLYQAICDMAMITASAHLRSSGRDGSASADELIEFGKDRSWQKPLIQAALQQSDTVMENYSQFTRELSDNAEAQREAALAAL